MSISALSIDIRNCINPRGGKLPTQLVRLRPFFPTGRQQPTASWAVCWAKKDGNFSGAKISWLAENTSMQNADIWIEFMDTIESVHINTTIENVSNTYLENSILN